MIHKAVLACPRSPGASVPTDRFMYGPVELMVDNSQAHACSSPSAMTNQELLPSSQDAGAFKCLWEESVPLWA